MNPKMKSAIEKITLNDATFSNEVIEPTYVNFFYGKNGAGKSTIARTFKANDERLQWQAGKASTDYDVLVYDTDFINANLRNYGNLAGVFTVNETNIAIQEQVDTLNAERKKMGEEYNGHKAAIDQKTADKNTAFVNTYEDIKAAFAPYYTTTLLANSVTPNAIYDLEATIDAYALFDPADIEAANDILYSQKVTGKQKQRLTFFLQKSKKLLEHYEYETQRQAVADMRGFVRYYEFLLQVSSFEDTDLHKKYNFISYLLAYINIKHPGGGFNLDGKIKASQFVQKKGEEHVSSDLVAKPVMKLPTAEHFGLSEDKEKRLSEIIDEINSKTGKNYDNDVVVKAMLQIRDILMKSDKLKTSAKNNTQQDFEFSYFDDIDDALIEGLSQNQDFFSMLLSNDEMKHQVMGIFSDEIYKSLRESV